MVVFQIASMKKNNGVIDLDIYLADLWRNSSVGKGIFQAQKAIRVTGDAIDSTKSAQGATRDMIQGFGRFHQWVSGGEQDDESGSEDNQSNQ